MSSKDSNDLAIRFDESNVKRKLELTDDIEAPTEKVFLSFNEI